MYEIDDDYRKYLSKHDSKVSLKIGRRFMGIIIGLKDYTYFIPLTSKPLRDNGKRRNTRTTVEIYDESKKLIAALLINNMIPVPEGAYRKIDIEKEKYKDYLESEYIYLRKRTSIEEIERKVNNVLKDVFIKKIHL